MIRSGQSGGPRSTAGHPSPRSDRTGVRRDKQGNGRIDCGNQDRVVLRKLIQGERIVRMIARRRAFIRASCLPLPPLVAVVSPILRSPLVGKITGRHLDSAPPSSSRATTQRDGPFVGVALHLGQAIHGPR